MPGMVDSRAKRDATSGSVSMRTVSSANRERARVATASGAGRDVRTCSAGYVARWGFHCPDGLRKGRPPQSPGDYVSRANGRRRRP